LRQDLKEEGARDPAHCRVIVNDRGARRSCGCRTAVEIGKTPANIARSINLPGLSLMQPPVRFQHLATRTLTRYDAVWLATMSGPSCGTTKPIT